MSTAVSGSGAPQPPPGGRSSGRRPPGSKVNVPGRRSQKREAPKTPSARRKSKRQGFGTLDGDSDSDVVYSHTSSKFGETYDDTDDLVFLGERRTPSRAPKRAIRDPAPGPTHTGPGSKARPISISPSTSSPSLPSDHSSGSSSRHSSISASGPSRPSDNSAASSSGNSTRSASAAPQAPDNSAASSSRHSSRSTSSSWDPRSSGPGTPTPSRPSTSGGVRREDPTPPSGSYNLRDTPYRRRAKDNR